MVSEGFKKWACSLSGCDGGNVNAKTWLCGIEWGGGSGDEGEYYESLKGQIRTGVHPGNDNLYNWEESLTYPFGRSFSKLYAAMKGEEVKNYKHFSKEVWSDSEVFKLNLYPIAFDSTDPQLWHDNKMPEITGFAEKYLYQTWCAFNRFPAFARLRAVHNPDLIVCTGVSYLRDFLMCFGGNQSNLGFVNHGDLGAMTSDKTRPRRYYWVELIGGTKLFVIPFFSGQYGLNSDALLQEMGEVIRDKVYA